MTVSIVNYNIRTYETKDRLAAELAGIILGLIRGKPGKAFNIALSGGSTPDILFHNLVEISGDSDGKIWENVSFYWVDERCVPPEHPDSNYRMANEILLKNIPVKPGNVFRMKGEVKPEDEASRYGRLLSDRLPEDGGLPVFDLILLGMGSDGHTASIFPDQMELLSSEHVCEVAYHPETRQARITLTGRIINNARKIFFLVTGEDKAITLKSVIGKGSPDPRYPAAHINPQKGTLTWYLDEKAASRLKQ